MIDEKGRLFGKINIVDLLVILVIIIAAAVLGVKFLKPGSSGSAGGGSASTHVTYTVLAENVRPEVYENIKSFVDAGDATLMASGEMLDGQVTDVTAVPHEDTISVDTTDGTVELPADQDMLDLTFTIECNVTNAITTEIGTQEVRVGKTHIVKTDKFEVTGVVTDCTWTENTK